MQSKHAVLQMKVLVTKIIYFCSTAPGAHPQLGKLVSANIHEFVIELQNGIRVHFPRTGFFVKPQSASAKHNL